MENGWKKLSEELKRISASGLTYKICMNPNEDEDEDDEVRLTLIGKVEGLADVDVIVRVTEPCDYDVGEQIYIDTVIYQGADVYEQHGNKWVQIR